MVSATVRYSLSLLFAALLTISLQGAAVAGDRLLFDEAHGQRFVMEKDGPLQLSSFAAILRDEGFTVKAGTERFSEESLGAVDVLVISGAFAPLDKAETDAVAGFISRGGRLAVMLHIPSPVADLIHGLGADFSNNVIHEQEGVIEKESLNFQVKNLETHPLFEGLSYFSLYGGWALVNVDESARVIAATSLKSWVDLDGDRLLSKGDAVQSFGVVVAGSKGSGRYLLFGDDAIFQNKFLDEQNRQLAHNLARWLK